MNKPVSLLRSALAGGAILGALWALPTASIAQQAVTLNGPTATATCTAASTTIGTNTITVNCAANPTTTGGSTPVTTATITLGAAYTMKLDGELGSIECGKRADIAVLEDDPETIGPTRLKDVRIWGTMQAGRIFPATEA